MNGESEQIHEEVAKFEIYNNKKKRRQQVADGAMSHSSISLLHKRSIQTGGLWIVREKFPKNVVDVDTHKRQTRIQTNSRRSRGGGGGGEREHVLN